MSEKEQRRKPLLTIRTDLYEQEHVDKFLAIKKKYMLDNNTEVIRSMIRELFEEIQKEKSSVSLSLKEK